MIFRGPAAEEEPATIVAFPFTADLGFGFGKRAEREADLKEFVGSGCGVGGDWKAESESESEP